ncbi:hypothetical protein AcV7_001176 [Taiwanofungus camphoratus]|nr:hypothetical protein AcV7_001176 [Antrodia cinnamomea]
MLRRRFLVWSPRGTRSGSINPRAISGMLSIHSNTEKSQGIYAMTSPIIRLNNHLQQTNQTHVLSWAESSKGPANALQWTIICKIGGQARGIGTASSKSAAKEAAALQALQSLGVA